MQQTQKPSVSVILPCYNERENIFLLIHEIHQVLTAHHWPHEIIVVDDNSPDKTYEALKERQAEFPYVKPVLRQIDPSLARSIRAGLECAQGDYLVVMDSDFNHSPHYLPILLANLSFYECVSSSRFVYGGNAYNKFRFLLSWLFNLLVRVTTRHFITDTLFGYVAIRRDVIAKLNYDLIFWGHGDYFIRFMYYLQLKKTSILQIPAQHTPRRHGQGNQVFIRTFIRYTRETLKLAFKNKARYI